MAYRNDEAQEAERLRNINQQLIELERRLAERNVLRAHKKRVDSQLVEAASAESKQRAKVPLPLLSRIRIASPCHERWDQMTGDERIRHCASCDKDVYDLSEMTTAEAEELLGTFGESVCVRLHRRADGTVITSDCPVGAKRKQRNRLLAAGAAMAGSAMAAVSFAATTGAPATGPGAPAFVEEPIVSTPILRPHNGDAVFDDGVDDEEYYAVPGGPMLLPEPPAEDENVQSSEP